LLPKKPHRLTNSHGGTIQFEHCAANGSFELILLFQPLIQGTIHPVMKKLLLLIFIFNCFIAEAQLPSWQWAQSAGRYTSHDYCYSLATDQNGNSYITGEFQDTIDFGSTTLINSGPYGDMMFITKYDAMGNILWAQNPAGMNGSTGKSVSADKHGYFYVTGSYRGTITLGTCCQVRFHRQCGLGEECNK
jgi:hypothetical protein